MKITDPIVVSLRGRWKEGKWVQQLEIGEDVSHALTTVQKDNLIAEPLTEPQAMRLARTDECKAKRRLTKDVGMSFKEGRYGEPRTDGILNTLTTVQKDNYIAIPRDYYESDKN